MDQLQRIKSIYESIKDKATDKEGSTTRDRATLEPLGEIDSDEDVMEMQSPTKKMGGKRESRRYQAPSPDVGMT